MAEFQEYPKWLHRHGHKSVLVEDADEEAAALAKWAPKEHPAARLENALIGEVAAEAYAFNAHAEAEAETAVRKSGWPKGKKRGPRNTAVN